MIMLWLIKLWLIAVVAAESVNLTDVFSKDEAGYYCIKIPYLTKLPSNRLLALGEGRVGSCSDYTGTDLVLKTSDDDGVTWSPLRVLAHSPSGTNKSTCGNAAPVVANNGDLVILFNENNLRVWLVRSSDEANTWTQPVDVSASTTLPGWKWVGLGPPSGLRLSTGRLLLPSYHTTIFAPTTDNGLVSKGHALLSDDDGYTWRISASHEYGRNCSSLDARACFPNECQAVELPPLRGSGAPRVASFARLLGFQRARTVSLDAGEHWGATELVSGLSEPLSGVEGSTIACPAGAGLADAAWAGRSPRLVFSGPVNTPLVRSHMSIFTSDDEGMSWELHTVVDAGSAGYSSLAWLRDGRLGLLYGRSSQTRLFFEPEHISFAALPSPC